MKLQINAKYIMHVIVKVSKEKEYWRLMNNMKHNCLEIVRLALETIDEHQNRQEEKICNYSGDLNFFMKKNANYHPSFVTP